MSRTVSLFVYSISLVAGEYVAQAAWSYGDGFHFASATSVEAFRGFRGDAAFLQTAERQKAAKSVSEDQSRERKNPFPYSRTSITEGKQIYMRQCVQCHDFDGRSLSGRDFAAAPPADLTYPQDWLHGTTEGEIFASIRDGTKEEMPPYKGKLKDDEIWHLVNFVRSLWPETMRPKLRDEP